MVEGILCRADNDVPSYFNIFMRAFRRVAEINRVQILAVEFSIYETVRRFNENDARVPSRLILSGLNIECALN